MTVEEQATYANYRFLETSAWRSWPAAQQQELFNAVTEQKHPPILPKPKPFGKDRSGRDIGTYTPEDYKKYEEKQQEVQKLQGDSAWFRERRDLLWPLDNYDPDLKKEHTEEERKRRKKLGSLRGNIMGKYEGDPDWDDVVPIPQDDGENALAQISYTPDYAEGKLTSHLIIRVLANGNSNGVPACCDGSERAL